MNMKKVLVFISLIFCFIIAYPQNGKLEVKTARLDNGMKVLLCEDHSTSEIYGGVCIHAGSKNDPAEATGMAHYLEHMMFKGTDKIGTLNWDLEKPLIDSISKLYDKLAIAKDKDKKNILKKINKLSAEAAQYAIPNEVDAILAQIGGSNVNAFTSNDITVYHNVFPAGELEKWSVIYAERFRKPVFRLFQSELEAVYEEYNMYSDDPFSVFAEDVEKAVFGEHPYGRPIIGLPEHIKNPSMSKMYAFFNTFYVPRNMTLILVGDFNTAEAIKILNETWCPNSNKKSIALDESQRFREKKPVKKQQDISHESIVKTLPAVQKFDGKRFIYTLQTPIKVGAICYQTEPSAHPNSIVLDLCAEILSNNSSTGLVDKLLNNNELYSFSCGNSSLSEAGVFEMTYIPKTEGQTHEQAEELINQCINKLKSGDFSNQLFEAVKMNYLKSEKTKLENIYSKFYTLLYLDVDKKTVNDYEKQLDKIAQLSKQDLVAIANQYFNDNVLIYRSDIGSKKTNTIDKPNWKPISSQNADKHSDFAQSLEEYNSIPSRIQKINFDKDVSITSINNVFDLYATKNPYNDIFSLKIVYDYGTIHHQDLENAIDYFNLQGTSSKSLEEFNLALQTMGADIYFSTSDNKTTINISGFEKDFEKILALCQEKLQNPENNEKKIDLLVEERINSLKMMKDDGATMGYVLYNYALYGKHSPYLTTPSTNQIKKYKGEELINVVRDALNNTGHLVFVGNIEPSIVSKIVKQHFQFYDVKSKKGNEKQTLSSFQDEKSSRKLQIRPVQNYSEPEIFVYNSSKFIQSNIYFYIPSKTVNEENKAKAILFNEYYDGGMNSVIFQNIRELRSLGYSAYAYFSSDKLNRRNGFTTGFLGTQADKTIDGIKAMTDLLKSFMLQNDKFSLAKESLIKQQEASFINFRNIPEQVYQWKLEGYENDPRSAQTSMIVNFKANDIAKFFDSYIGQKPIVISICGNMNRINKKQLAKFGKITFLNFSDISNN